MFDAIKILRWVGLTMYFLGSAVLVAQELPLPGDVPPSLTGSNEREYVIGTNDRLSISEWQTQSFSTQGMVRTDGKITIAYLGDVQAAGLKVSTFRKNLEMPSKNIETADDQFDGRNVGTNPDYSHNRRHQLGRIRVAA
jgi:protein involved in polysaccharide export with SLBB domain